MARTNSRPRKSSTRVKRPELGRTEPTRSWSGIFGADGAGPVQPKPRADGAAAAARPSAGRSKPAQTVQRGVELGYRVIDEYMKQGAAVANAFGGPRRSHTPSGDDLPMMTQRMMQYASDLSSLWFDAMGVLMKNDGERAAANGANGANGATDRPAASGKSSARSDVPAREPDVQRTRIVLELRSSQAAEIIVAFDEPLLEPVRIEPLRARAGSQKITDAAIEPRTDPAGPLKVRVHVPNRIRPGRYSGAILDIATGKPRGRLTVSIAK